MLNLSFGELMTSAPDVSEGAYLTKGGWPELHARSDLDPHFWYAAYLSTYLERDVRNILNVGSLRDFDRFLRAAAARTGQLLSYSDLTRDVGIAPNTANSGCRCCNLPDRSFCWNPITATSANAC